MRQRRGRDQRPNNDLEHFFGAARYHERRTTGRRNASPGLAVRLVAAMVTPLHPLSATISDRGI